MFSSPSFSQLKPTSKSSPTNGFLAETFIRPPVRIQIQFKDPIQLHSIRLDAKVNSQISNGFTITTTNAKQTSKQISKHLNKSSAADSHVYLFTRRAKSAAETVNPESVNLVSFYADPREHLDHVISISIEIFSTLNSTTPGLKSLRVFGAIPSSGTFRALAPSETNARVDLGKKNVLELPDEFVDCLTCELMRMPIRLPSNKYVDKSTLDRYLISSFFVFRG